MKSEIHLYQACLSSFPVYSRSGHSSLLGSRRSPVLGSAGVGCGTKSLRIANVIAGFHLDGDGLEFFFVNRLIADFNYSMAWNQQFLLL